MKRAAVGRRAAIPHRLGILVFGAAILVGCRAASNAPSAVESVQPSSSDVPAPAAVCEPIDLVTPAGNRVDLTGTWLGGMGVHYIQQEGSCVWWVAQNDDPRTVPVTYRLVMFQGTIDDAFTLTGEWRSVIQTPLQFITNPVRGTVTFHVEIDSDGGDETIALVSTTPGPEQGGTGPYTGVTVTYEGPLPPVPGE